MREVTIYRIYDNVHYTAPDGAPKAPANYFGCLDSDDVQYPEISEGRYSDSIKKGLSDGSIEGEPGFYLLLEFNENIDEYRGMLYTIDEHGTFHAGCVTQNTTVPRLTSWPPRS